jgi:hypothetical protein
MYGIDGRSELTEEVLTHLEGYRGSAPVRIGKRIIARSMTEAAMRLAEPETIARESIVSVGQAIRREVAAMGDGVERALARAAELEALVHNEVAALERAYNDNELRIRGLIEDLANQRDSLVGQAEQVRNAITGVHLVGAAHQRFGDRERLLRHVVGDVVEPRREHLRELHRKVGDLRAQVVGLDVDVRRHLVARRLQRARDLFAGARHLLEQKRVRGVLPRSILYLRRSGGRDAPQARSEGAETGRRIPRMAIGRLPGVPGNRTRNVEMNRPQPIRRHVSTL